MELQRQALTGSLCKNVLRFYIATASHICVSKVTKANIMRSRGLYIARTHGSLHSLCILGKVVLMHWSGTGFMEY